MKIAFLLKETRQQLGLKQISLAKEIGCSQPILSQWESHSVTPSITNLRKILIFVNSNKIFSKKVCLDDLELIDWRVKKE